MRLLLHDEKFFDLHIESPRSALNQPSSSSSHSEDALHRPPLVDAIKRLEHKADQDPHEVVTRLDRVFITRQAPCP
jgi:hypothetical protein